MEFLSDVGLGFAAVLQPGSLLVLAAGTLVGLLVGALPGISAPMTIALFVPLSYTMDIVPALLFITALYCGADFGGAITAILMKMPGDPGNAATCFDGYELARQGQAGKALGVAAVGSAIGGQFSTLVLLFLTPLLAQAALSFGAAEYFAVAFLGLSAVSSLGAGSRLKSLTACVIGLFLATVGTDEITGAYRFTFDSMYLMDGLQMVPALIGLFAFAEVLDTVAMGSDGSAEVVSKNVSTVRPSWQELLALKWTILKSSLIGTWVGIVPATGGTIASFLGYAAAVRSSKHPETFGHGEMEGVAAAETANSAAIGGSYVPTLALGIPGSACTAIMIGAFTLHGLRPGPLLFEQQGALMYTIIIGMFIANFMFLFAGFAGTRYFAKLLDVPVGILMPIVVVLCIVGAYGMRNSLGDVAIMFFMGILAYLLSNRGGFPIAPLVLAFVLGEMMEANFRRAIVLEGDIISGVLTRPISGTLVVIALLVFFSPWLSKLRKRARSNQSAGAA